MRSEKRDLQGRKTAAEKNFHESVRKKSFLSFTTEKKGHSSTTNECKAEMGHRTNFSSSVKRKKKEEVHTKTPLSLVGKKLV